MSLHPLRIDFSDTDMMCAPQVQIGETTFFFRRLPATESWPLLLRLREDLARASVQLVSTDEQIVSQIFNGLFLLPTDRVLYYQSAMFRYVEFSNSQMSRQVLEGLEETAFNTDAGIGAFHIFEILARIFCVNFLESFSFLFAEMTPGSMEKEENSAQSPMQKKDFPWDSPKEPVSLRGV